MRREIGVSMPRTRHDRPRPQSWRATSQSRRFSERLKLHASEPLASPLSAAPSTLHYRAIHVLLLLLCVLLLTACAASPPPPLVIPAELLRAQPVPPVPDNPTDADVARLLLDYREGLDACTSQQARIGELVSGI
jgi:hypothetical protein